MEALQATIEKMKVDHEAAAKKWKLAEARWSICLRGFSLTLLVMLWCNFADTFLWVFKYFRLYSLIKEHTAHIESSEKQVCSIYNFV